MSPDVELPTYESLARRHNERVDRVQELSARGVVELRWTDEDGRHLEQGDIDVWIAMPDRIALNISKFSERFMWIGSGAGRAWLFDFRGDRTTLDVVDAGDGRRQGGPVPINPATLVALCGLIRLPATPVPVEYDRDLDAFAVTVAASVPLRMLLDRATGLPVRAELLEDGAVLVSSMLKLDRYDRLEMAGAAGFGPEVPTLIDITGGEGLQVKLSVRGPRDTGVKDQFFDLEWLKERFEPVAAQRIPPVAAGH